MEGDTRLWMYRRGEARLFEHPDHVPDAEDWQRFPQPEGEAAETGDAQVHGSSAPDPDGALSQEEKLDRMSRKRLTHVAADCGICFRPDWTKAELKKSIIEVLNGNRS
jgi:hypothetical protein